MTESDSCLFCRIIAGEIPATKVFEDDRVFAFRDINPAAPTHVLVVPRRHVAKLGDCGDAHRDLLADVMLGANRAAEAENLDSYRVIINNGPGAGQTVYHLHAHVIGGRKMGEKLL